MAAAFVAGVEALLARAPGCATQGSVAPLAPSDVPSVPPESPSVPVAGSGAEGLGSARPVAVKLGACYNVFDGEELLEASVRSIRAGGVVQYVCVVYQTGEKGWVKPAAGRIAGLTQPVKCLHSPHFTLRRGVH
jgi:hypothetical protein